FNSSSAAERCRLSRSVFAPKQLYVIRNGLDFELFRNVPLLRDVRVHDGRINIVGIGSLVPLKRWDRLLRAVVALKQSGVDCLIQIAGDGQSRGLLEHQARSLGVADSVTFIGHTDDIAKFLANASFLVHTS